MIFDCCDGGLGKNNKHKENPSKELLFFDGATYIKRTRRSKKNEYMFERLKYPCNGRHSSKKDDSVDKHFLWCNSYQCFRSAIQRHDGYKRYKFIDFCSAFGFTVYEDTDSGIVYNDALSRFTDTLSKVSRIAPHLYCESCKQLLFPDKRSEKEFISTYNTFSCHNPSCEQQEKSIYINHCHTTNCRGVIDSRLQKKCPNGMHICSECFGCCSDGFYKKQKAFRLSYGIPVPSGLENQIANHAGHNDKDIFYCYKCGNLLIDNTCNDCGIERETVK